MKVKCKCGSTSFLAGPRAGYGQNIKCESCGTIYLISPFGMEEISHSQMEGKKKVIILDNNPLSIASYLEDHPEVELEDDTRDD